MKESFVVSWLVLICRRSQGLGLSQLNPLIHVKISESLPEGSSGLRYLYTWRARPNPCCADSGDDVSMLLPTKKVHKAVAEIWRRSVEITERFQVALLTISVCLIVIQGSSPYENRFQISDLAGLPAPTQRQTIRERLQNKCMHPVNVATTTHLQESTCGSSETPTPQQYSS